MKYRTLGRTGWQVSEIGLGTEYLLGQPEHVMDEVMAAAVDAGANYVDLLYNGPRFWDQFAPTMKRYRDRVMVAAHWGVGESNGQLENVREQDVCRRFFESTLASLGNDYADVGMLMMVDTMQLWDTWAQESLQQLARYKRDGRIGAIGMSGHKAEVALKAVQSGQIDVLMYPVNMASWAVEGNPELYAACARHGVGLVAMKPYAGGAFFLGEKSVTLYWFRSGGRGLDVDKPGPITPVQCLSYTLSQPVSTIVPGVKNAQEFHAALHYLDASDEEKNYAAAITQIRPSPAGNCIYCNHCLPCPEGIDIGQTIHLVDRAHDGVTLTLMADYAALPVAGSGCIECGVCMERCPYEVDVPAKMRLAAGMFE